MAFLQKASLLFGSFVSFFFRSLVFHPKTLATILSIIICLIGSNYSFAQVIPADADVQVTLAEESGVDLLHLSPANSAGISVNRFSGFSVDARPLHILNIPKTISTLTGDQAVNAASLIVIIADNISLQNTIKVLGPATEVLFLSLNTAGNINCASCVFENFLRVTLATGISSNSVSNSSLAIGELTPGASSSININYLTAPGVVAVDVITQHLTLNGIVESHQRAIHDPEGGYQSSPTGNLRIGSGAVNLLLGPITWDYDQRQITSVSTYSGTHTVGGTIRSSAVKMSAAGDLVVNSFADTRTNLLSSVNYRGGVYVPNEGIELQTFAGHSLTVSGDQRSAGAVALKATGDLALSSLQTDIEAEQIELIAGGTLSNVARIDGAYIEMAGDRLINQGDLTADIDINLWAHKQLANQYGGLIKADTVRLQSVTQAIRNGSRTPYMSQASETDYLFNMDNYVNQLDSARLGTFYSLEEVDVSNNSYVMAEDNSAHIVANRIEIQGQAFENINPYYKKANTNGEIIFNKDYVGQVLVSAESYLGIVANRYITNSSAYVVVNQPHGIFESITGLFTNERYLNFSQLLQDIDVVNQTQSDNSVHQTTFSTYTSQTVVNSPPGVFVAMGDVEIKATQGILNNMAYLEIFGNAKFDTPLVNDIGLESQSIHEEKTYIYNSHGGCHYAGCIILPDIANYSSISFNPVEQDSLFLVHGNLQANAALGWFRNHKPVNTYVEEAMEYFADSRPDLAIEINESTIEETKETGTISGFTGTLPGTLYNTLKTMYDNITESASNFLESLGWWD